MKKEIKAKIENLENGKFNFYYPNVHPKTDEVTEGIFIDKTLKEIKEFSKRRGLEKDVAELIKQTSSAVAKEKRLKKQAAEAEELKKWKASKWFGEGEKLRKAGTKWWRREVEIGITSPARTYLSYDVSEEIRESLDIDCPYGNNIFYDHEKRVWSAKKLGARYAKKLNTYLTYVI